MKTLHKTFLLTALFCCALARAGAEVAVLKISDEESYKSKKDFTNTYEIDVNENGTANIEKCQAVRLKKNWFLTAAHCVEQPCKNVCDMQARLIVGENYEADLIATHNAKNSKKIFIVPRKEKDLPMANDLALIFFEPFSSKTVFKDPAEGNIALSEEEFLSRSKDAAQYYKAINGTNIPPVLVFTAKERKALKRSVSIISIWSGKREVLNSRDTVFFTPEGGFLFTINFGVIRGISGSGVMTNTGELAGITSAKADFFAPSEKGPVSTPLLFITPVTESSLAFIKERVPSLNYIIADEEYLRDLTATEKNAAEIIEEQTYKLLSTPPAK